MATLLFRRFLSSKPPSPVLTSPNVKEIKKCPEGFIRVPDRLDREVLLRNWKSPTGKAIDFVLAAPRDVDLVVQFAGNHFAQYNNLSQHLGMTYEEFKPLCYIATERAFQNGDHVFGFWGDRLVSTLAILYYDKSEFPELFNNELPGHPNPVLHIKDDYADDIASMPYGPKLNRSATFLKTAFSQLGKFLPGDVEKVANFEAVAVHPKMQKDKIASLVIKVGHDVMEKRGYTDAIGVGISRYTTRLCHKLGWKTIFEFPYKDFKENGKPVFYDLKDGTEIVDGLHYRSKR